MSNENPTGGDLHIVIVSPVNHEEYVNARLSVETVVRDTRSLVNIDEGDHWGLRALETGRWVGRWLHAAMVAGAGGFAPLTTVTGLAPEEHEVVAPMLWAPDRTWLYLSDVVPRWVWAERAQVLEDFGEQLGLPTLPVIGGILRFVANHHLASEHVLPLSAEERDAVSALEGERCFEDTAWPDRRTSR